MLEKLFLYAKIINYQMSLVYEGYLVVPIKVQCSKLGSFTVCAVRLSYMGHTFSTLTVLGMGERSGVLGSIFQPLRELEG